MELLGMLLPVLIDLINRKIADSDVRFWVSVGICAAVGAFLNFLETSFAFPDLKAAFSSVAGSIGVVFTMAQVSYKGIWSNTSILGEFRNEMGLNAKEQ